MNGPDEQRVLANLQDFGGRSAWARLLARIKAREFQNEHNPDVLRRVTATRGEPLKTRR